MILKRYNELIVPTLFLLFSCGEKYPSETEVSSELQTAKQLTHTDPSNAKAPINAQDLNKTYLPLQKSRILAEPLMPFTLTQPDAYDHE